MAKPKRTAWLISVGARFRALRKEAGKRQGDLGVSPTSIRALEQGLGAGLDLIEVACRAMAIEPSEVFASFPVTSAVQSGTAPTEEGEPMLNRPDAKILLGYLQAFDDDALGRLKLAAVAIDGERKRAHSPPRGAQPARKERLQRG